MMIGTMEGVFSRAWCLELDLVSHVLVFRIGLDNSLDLKYIEGKKKLRLALDPHKIVEYQHLLQLST